jgi:hypothetical protein
LQAFFAVLGFGFVLYATGVPAIAKLLNLLSSNGLQLVVRKLLVRKKSRLYPAGREVMMARFCGILSQKVFDTLHQMVALRFFCYFV